MPKLKLRDYQEKAIQSIYRYFSNNDGNPLVVAPTGSGKSLMIAEFVRGVHTELPSHKTLILSHVKELIAQNAAKIADQWPQAPMGIYHAGLKLRQHNYPIMVAGIQSIYRKPEILGHIDLIIIDEAHMLSPNNTTMYRKLINHLKKWNPQLKVLGFTATPYRTNSGCLIVGENPLFTDFCYDIPLRDLVNEGYLAPLTAISSDQSVDMAGVSVRGGEYVESEMQSVMNTPELIEAALDETFAKAADRKTWLFFCSGVAHAEAVCQALRARGKRVECVTGDTPAVERDKAIRALKNGQLDALTNNSVLTTGTDIPGIDLIVLLRATLSPVLYVQMLGRGMRLNPGKHDCLVLDYGTNVERHGPIESIKGFKKKAGEGKGEPPTKECPECGLENHARRTFCSGCGYEFPPPETAPHETKAAEREIMFGSNQHMVDVDAVTYSKHVKRSDGKESFKITYQCGLMYYNEYRSLAVAFSQMIFRSWWQKQRKEEFAGEAIPSTIEEALAVAPTQLRKPARIRLEKDGRYTKVTGYEF